MKTLISLSKLTLLLATIFASGSLYAKKTGTESGGGGGVVYLRPTTPVLMDYFTIIKDIDELPNSAPTLPVVEGSQISPDTFIGVKKIIAPWTKLPFDCMSILISITADLMTWNFVEEELIVPDFFLTSNLPKNAQITPAAFYLGGAVSLSRPIWNSLKERDQNGLLIHEILRHLQIGFGQNYDDEALQRATAIYLICKPSGRLNNYVFYLLNNASVFADEVYGNFDLFIKKECKRLE